MKFVYLGGDAPDYASWTEDALRKELSDRGHEVVEVPEDPEVEVTEGEASTPSEILERRLAQHLAIPQDAVVAPSKDELVSQLEADDRTLGDGVGDGRPVEPGDLYEEDVPSNATLRWIKQGWAQEFEEEKPAE